MKILLFLLLIGFIVSDLGCIRYNIGRIKEERKGNTCPCPHGYKQSLPKGTTNCYCYSQSQISECKANRKCSFDIDMGCYQ